MDKCPTCGWLLSTLTSPAPAAGEAWTQDAECANPGCERRGERTTIRGGA